jgi:hypothetical protein
METDHVYFRAHYMGQVPDQNPTRSVNYGGWVSQQEGLYYAKGISDDWVRFLRVQGVLGGDMLSSDEFSEVVSIPGY